MISAFPIVFQDYIQCLCDPTNIWKDILENECLLGNLTSVVRYSSMPTTISHENYKKIPFLLLSLMVMSLIPSLVWKCLNGNLYFQLITGLQNYNPSEVEFRSIRLQWFLKEECTYISRMYFSLIFGDILGAGGLAYQIYLCNSIVHQVFYEMVRDFLKGENIHRQLFPQTAICVVQKSAPGGEIDVEEFRCILNMNWKYCVMFEILLVLYGIGGILHLMSLFARIFSFSSFYKR